MPAIKNRIPSSKFNKSVSSPNIELLETVNKLSLQVSKLSLVIQNQQEILGEVYQLIHDSSMTDHYNLFNQKELAERLGIHPHHVAKMIRQGLEFLGDGPKKKIPWINFVRFAQENSRKYGDLL